MTTFQQYKLPPNTLVEKRTCFEFEPQYKVGPAQLNHPSINVACLFDAATNRKVLGTDPGQILGTEGEFFKELKNRYTDQKVIDALWQREMFVRLQMTRIYQIMMKYFVGVDTTDDDWCQSPGIEGGHIVCDYLFDRTFTDEQASPPFPPRQTFVFLTLTIHPS